MPTSIAAQSHCFVDWLFINALSVRIIHVCKGLWKLPAAQVLWMIRTCRSSIVPEHVLWNDPVPACSDWSPESSRRTARRNHSDFQGDWKLWGFLHPFGSALSADHVRIVRIFPNSHSDSCISVQTESILKGWPAVFLYFVMLMVRFAFAGARRIQRSCPNAWSGKIRGRDVPAR